MEGTFTLGNLLGLTEERIKVITNDLTSILSESKEEKGINMGKAMIKVFEFGKSLRSNENAYLLMAFGKIQGGFETLQKPKQTIGMLAAIEGISKIKGKERGD